MDSAVTIIVVPRERFSYTIQSLQSIYEHTQYPFELIYIDAGSPPEIKSYLQLESHKKQFQLIRRDTFLPPNVARNIGLNFIQNYQEENNSKYIVFIDNDVIVTPGWLRQLVKCADSTDASIVSPLICHHLPLHTEVHCAGGASGIKISQQGDISRRSIIEKIYYQGRQVKDVRPQLQRQETGLAEFHCMLVARDIFAQIGFLDEELLNTKEHLDLCLLVQQIGKKIYLEPDSLVTYVPSSPMNWSDLNYYMIRWSDAWEFASLKRLQKKWNLTEDAYFKNRYQRLGWRREMTIINPFLQKLPLGKLGKRGIGKILRLLDKRLNSYLTSRAKFTSSLPQSQLRRQENQPD